MNYHHLCVGTANLARALEFWQGILGMAVKSRPDVAMLETLWDLPTGTIRGACQLETPSANAGALLLVEFDATTPAVRQQAGVTDLCPKNLDVNCIDLPARVRALQAAGYRMRSAPVDYAIGDLQVREVQLPLEEGVNLVLAEILGEPLVTTPTHYGAITSVVTTTADIEEESRFFEALGFQRLDRPRLEGPAIETMVGLPAGGVLHMQLLGEPATRFGRAELVSYGGASGADHYPRTRPPALGLFRAAIRVRDMPAVRRACSRAGYALTDVVSLAGPGKPCQACSVQSPSGWWIDLLPLPA